MGSVVLGVPCKVKRRSLRLFQTRHPCPGAEWCFDVVAVTVGHAAIYRNCYDMGAARMDARLMTPGIRLHCFRILNIRPQSAVSAGAIALK